MKKLISILFIFFMVFGGFAGDIDPVFGLDSDNPFELHPPVWIQGFWEDDIGHAHMQISPDGIVADFISYRLDNAGIELSLSLLEKLYHNPSIFDFEFRLSRNDSGDFIGYYNAHLIKQCYIGYLYDFFSTDPINLSSEYLMPYGYQLFEQLGITSTDNVKDVKQKVEEAIAQCNSIINEYGDNPDYSLSVNDVKRYMTLLENMQELASHEPYDFDVYLIETISLLSTANEMNELLENCSVAETTSYPYYGLKFYYDDTEFASIDFIRSEDELTVSLELFCYYDYEWDSVPETIEGISRENLEEHGLREEFEFEFREYSMNKKAVR